METHESRVAEEPDLSRLSIWSRQRQVHTQDMSAVGTGSADAETLS